MKHQFIVFLLFVMATACVKTQTNENVFQTKVGNSKVFLLSEGQRAGNTQIIIGATPEIIKEYAPGDTFPMATNAFLWQVNGKNILFDTGYGKVLFDNLQFLQLKPEDIDAVFITHMHGDHISGLLRNDQPAFPKATLYIAQPEYDYWTNEATMNQMPENSRGGFLLSIKMANVYKDRLHLFVPDSINSPDSPDLYPGIKAFASCGHTPGHTVYLITSDKNKLLIWGDLTHAMAIQMPHPEIAVTYDSYPDQAIQSRLAVLQFVSGHKIPIAGMHIAYPAIGTIEKAEPGYRFIPAK